MLKHLILVSLMAIVLISCQSEEDIAWEKAVRQNSSTAIDSFLITYPGSKYSMDAASFKEDYAWYTAKAKNTVYNYKKYAVDFPNGKYNQEVPTRLDSINSGSINLTEMTKSSFVGKIDYGNRETEILAFHFSEITQDSAGISFLAKINTSDIRKVIAGRIDPNGYLIMFMEDPNDKIMLNITDGRAYIKGNKIMMESTNINQYWSLIKYNEE
jgi:hypothetical protein